MSVKITDNTAQLINDTTQRASIFLRVACDSIVNESTPNTPKDKGNLSRDTLKSVIGLHATVEWRKVYASYQEAGQRKDGSHKVKNYTTPGTGPHFAENAVLKISSQTDILAKLSHLI